MPNKQHQQPFIPQTARELMTRYRGVYLGDPGSKKIYLTFDTGYENGNTSRILDTLAAHQVKAAFFVTKPYITTQPSLVKRMVAEGHLVGNHTATHPSLPTITDAQVVKEVRDTEAAFASVTGKEMPKFLRPPNGEYSEHVLALLASINYRPVLWSMAFRDWDVTKQPGSTQAFHNVVDNIHPGAVILLHSVSASNAEVLDSIITELKKQGYQFAALTEL